MAEIFLQIEAEQEYEAAVGWYFERSQQAATKFEIAFEYALASIKANPDLYPKCDEHHRFCRLRRYPYSVIYRVDSDQIRVIAVAHSSRMPGYWSGRK